PLIYRIAINDVAGLFVDRSGQAVQPDETDLPQIQQPTNQQPANRQPANPKPSPAERKRHVQLERAPKTLQQHHTGFVAPPGFVAPRTSRQTLITLLWAAAGLFFISVIGYYLSLLSEYQSTVVASDIEARLIQSTFGHVLRLPIGFFSR